MIQINNLMFSKEMIGKRDKVDSKQKALDFSTFMSNARNNTMPNGIENSTSHDFSKLNSFSRFEDRGSNGQTTNDTPAVENEANEMKIENKTKTATETCEETNDSRFLEEDIDDCQLMEAYLQLIGILEERGVFTHEETESIKLALEEDVQNLMPELVDHLQLIDERLKVLEKELQPLEMDLSDNKGEADVIENKELLKQLKETLEVIVNNQEAEIHQLNKPVNQQNVNTVEKFQEYNEDHLLDFTQKENEIVKVDLYHQKPKKAEEAQEKQLEKAEFSHHQESQINFIDANNLVNNKANVFDEKIKGALQQSFMEPQAIISQVVNKIDLLVLNHRSEMRLQLSPENLGTITLKLTVEDGVLSGKVFTNNPAVKELLENNLQQLKINLGEKGISVNSLEVSVGQDHQQFREGKTYFNNKQRFKKIADGIDNLVDMAYMDNAINGTNPYIIKTKFDGIV